MLTQTAVNAKVTDMRLMISLTISRLHLRGCRQVCNDYALKRLRRESETGMFHDLLMFRISDFSADE
jgi:hypothetical protein